jgi:hypothetical protein
MNRNCENFKEKIADSLSQNIEKERQHLLEHIKGCSECNAFEIAVKAEDELLNRLFAGLQAGFQGQQDDVIKAISYIEMSTKDRIIAKINSFIDHPAFKLTAAAAVIVVVAFYSIKTMGWLYDLKYFMDACAVTLK